MSNAMQKKETATATTVKELLERNKGAIASVLPRHISVDRLFRVAIGAISRTPGLQECTPSSLFLAVVQAATLGLEPSGALGEAYLVPYFNSKARCKEVQFIPGYRGLINLARRSGEVSLFYAEKVCENDTFRMKRGLNPDLEHEITVGERGPAVGYYAVFHTKDGMKDFEFMTLNEIKNIQSRSKSGNNGPWKTDFDEMAKKTAIRRLAKRAPMSVEMAMAVSADNRAAMGEGPDYSDLPTSEFTGVTIEASAASPMEIGDGIDEDYPEFPVEIDEKEMAGVN